MFYKQLLLNYIDYSLLIIYFYKYNFPTVKPSEMQFDIKQMKHNKTPDEDNVTTDLIKYATQSKL